MSGLRVLLGDFSTCNLLIVSFAAGLMCILCVGVGSFLCLCLFAAGTADYVLVWCNVHKTTHSGKNWYQSPSGAFSSWGGGGGGAAVAALGSEPLFDDRCLHNTWERYCCPRPRIQNCISGKSSFSLLSTLSNLKHDL